MRAVGSIAAEEAIVECEESNYTCATAIKCEQTANSLRISFKNNLVFECHIPSAFELLNPVAYKLSRKMIVSVEQIAA